MDCFCQSDTIIITGATGGIGYECALQLARMAPDHQLILVCRDQGAGQQVIQQINQRTHHAHLCYLPLDLTSLQSVRAFVQLIAQLPNNRIVALLNNADVQNVGKPSTPRTALSSRLG